MPPRSADGERIATADREEAEPGQHLVELVTVGGQLVADRVPVAELASRNDGSNCADRALGALAPTDPKVVEPSIGLVAGVCTELMTS